MEFEELRNQFVREKLDHIEHMAGLELVDAPLASGRAKRIKIDEPQTDGWVEDKLPNGTVFYWNQPRLDEIYITDSNDIANNSKASPKEAMKVLPNHVDSFPGVLKDIVCYAAMNMGHIYAVKNGYVYDTGMRIPSTSSN